MNTYIQSTNNRSSKDIIDLYTTDPKAVQMLLNMEKFNKVILEPACGLGHISKVLSANKYKVISQDLYDFKFGKPNKDFFDLKKWDSDIITNPPFNLAFDFVKHALNIINTGNKVAMFLRFNFIESKKRQSFFKQNPPYIIYVSSSRLTCLKNGDPNYKATGICYAWFIWKKGFKGTISLKLFN